MVDFKTQLKIAYDKDAKRRDNEQSRGGEWKNEIRAELVRILNSENKKTILELGAGAGHDSKFFKSHGFDVLATDLSPEMVKLNQKRGTKAQVLDLYDLNCLTQKFDAIYSMNVLLHVPKNDLHLVLSKIHDRLSEGGIFFYGVNGRGQDTEETRTDGSKMNLPRFFSYLSDKSLFEFIGPYFEIIKLHNIDRNLDQNFHFQGLFLRRK